MTIQTASMQETKHRNVSWFSVIALSLLIIVQEIPFLQRQVGGYWLYVPFILLLGISTVSRRINLKRSNVGFVLSTLFYFGIAFLYKLVGISSAGYGHDIHPILFYVLFLSMFFVIDMNRTQKIYTLWIISLSMFVTVITNIIDFRRLGDTYFDAFRYETFLNTTNIIPTQYSGALMLMGGVLLIAILHDSNLIRKSIWIVLFVISNLFNLLVMQRTITLIFSIAMYALIILFNARQRAFVSLLTLVGAVGLIVVILNYETVLTYVGQLFGDSRIAAKLNQITRYLNSGDIQEAGGSLTARYNLYFTSISTWLGSMRSFLFGIGDHISSNRRIGNHSQFFDVLGQYGVLGAVPLYYSVYRTMKSCMQILSVPSKSPIFYQCLVICVIFVARGFFGNVLFEYIAVRLFVFFPIIISLIGEKEASAA